MNSACQLCVEYKESNNNEIISSAEKVVRPWPDRRLRPCNWLRAWLCIHSSRSLCYSF